MLHGSCVLQNAEQRNGDRFRECARSRVRIGLGGVTLSAELQGVCQRPSHHLDIS